MKRLTNWKVLTCATIAQALFVLQPAITYACSGGSHTGC